MTFSCNIKWVSISILQKYIIILNKDSLTILAIFPLQLYFSDLQYLILKISTIKLLWTYKSLIYSSNDTFWKNIKVWESFLHARRSMSNCIQMKRSHYSKIRAASKYSYDILITNGY